MTATATTTSDLPHVDPHASRGRLTDAYIRVLGTEAVRSIAMRLAPQVDPWLLRFSGGRIDLSMALPTALLTTRGAKSGTQRVNPVFYFHDGDDVILIASSFGREAHTAWYHNLKAHPSVRLGKAGGGPGYDATEIDDVAELERLWPLADRVFAPYAGYRERAAKNGRVIPVVRLRPSHLS